MLFQPSKNWYCTQHPSPHPVSSEPETRQYQPQTPGSWVCRGRSAPTCCHRLLCKAQPPPPMTCRPTPLASASWVSLPQSASFTSCWLAQEPCPGAGWTPYLPPTLPLSERQALMGYYIGGGTVRSGHLGAWHLQEPSSLCVQGLSQTRFTEYISAMRGC